jgi:murein L,D-transpeptidase YcbB/YkuD
MNFTGKKKKIKKGPPHGPHGGEPVLERADEHRRERDQAKLRKNPNYLEQNNMYRREDGRIVQRPGPDNALGTVKFMFPNKHAIYLHDTPSRHLFAEDMRALSHGCIRLEDPHGFALALLVRQSEDPEHHFSSALATGRQSTIQLEEPIPVHLTYQTAWIDGSGDAQFRPDVYGRDAAILEALVSAGLRLEPESAAPKDAEIAALP